MAGTFVNNGLIDMVGAKRTALNGYTLHLYSNNHTPVQTDTVAAYTETTGTGYAAQNITSFGAGYLNGSSQGETDSGTFTFTPTGTGLAWTIYGFYILDAGGALVAAWKDPGGPITLTGPSTSYLLTISVLDIAA